MADDYQAASLVMVIGVGFGTLGDVLSGFMNFSGDPTAAVLAPPAVAIGAALMLIMTNGPENDDATGVEDADAIATDGGEL